MLVALDLDGQAKVCELDKGRLAVFARGRHQQILRLDVAVDNVFLVTVDDDRQDLLGECRRHLLRQLLPLHNVLEELSPGDELKHQVADLLAAQRGVDDDGVNDPDDVGMVELAADFGFRLEPIFIFLLVQLREDKGLVFWTWYAITGLWTIL